MLEVLPKARLSFGIPYVFRLQGLDPAGHAEAWQLATVGKTLVDQTAIATDRSANRPDLSQILARS